MDRFLFNSLKLWSYSPSRKPLILRGARQVGKSTLVRLFAQENHLKLFEINLEKNLDLKEVFASLNISKIIEAIGVRLNDKITSENTILFLDEIQFIPEAIAALRYFFEEKPELRVISAGSLLEFALTEERLSMPVGRVEYMYVGPLSFAEFLTAKNELLCLEKMQAWKLGDEWSEILHLKMMELLREYFFLGGMPEPVATFIKTKDRSLARAAQNNIIFSYKDDFYKYSKKANIAKLNEIFNTIPTSLGEKVKYSQLLPHEHSRQTKTLLDMLGKAGIVSHCYHSDANRIPLGAEINLKVFKLFFVDIGLYNQMLRLEWEDLSGDVTLYHEGILAEQFVAQELISSEQLGVRPELYYWIREGKNNNAQLDFLIQKGVEIIPVEVKSGKSGSLKSLQQFMFAKKRKVAIRLGNLLPSREEVSHEITTAEGKQGVEFTLLNLPIYFAAKIKALLQFPFPHQ